MREERERMRRILHGLIPWDVESFIEAHTFAARLRKTPKDDWDHKEQSITMDLSQGPEIIKEMVRDSLTNLTDVGLMEFSEQTPGIVVAKFNSAEFMNQMSVFIRDKSDDPHIGMAHAMRFFEMGHFFRVHRRRLIKAGFIRLTGETDDPVLGVKDDIHESLLTALCELPYKGRRRQGPSGYTPTFKLAAVLKRAEELKAEDEADGTHEA